MLFCLVLYLYNVVLVLQISSWDCVAYINCGVRFVLSLVQADDINRSIAEIAKHIERIKHNHATILTTFQNQSMFHKLA